MPGSSERREVLRAMQRTHRWAVRSLRAHSREDQALFGIAQGGIDPALRAESATFIRSLPFEGINLGGLAGDETPAERNTAIEATIAALEGDQRVRYLMGLGSPIDLLDAVLRGVDLFDSVLPARVARNGQAWVTGGRMNLRNARHLDEDEPLMGNATVPPAGGSAAPTLPTSFVRRSCLATDCSRSTTCAT